MKLERSKKIHYKFVYGSVLSYLARHSACVVGILPWVAFAAVFLTLMTSPSLAFEKNWINPNGGSFHDAGNWDPFGTPTSDQDVIFGLNQEQPYEIFFSQEVTVYDLIVQTDNLAMDLGGNDFSVWDARVGDREGDVGNLFIQNGTFNIDQNFIIGVSSGSLGTFVFENGFVNISNDLRVGMSTEGISEVRFLNGTTVDIGNRFDIGRSGEGRLELRGEGTLLKVPGTRPRIGRDAPGIALVADGATLHVVSDFRIGWNGQDGDISSATFDQGNLIVDGGLHISDGANTIGEAFFMNGSNVMVGNRFDVGRTGVGHLEISGPGTIFSVGGVNSRVGRNARSTAMVSDGALLDVSGDLRVGWNGADGDTSTLTVDGATLQVEGDLAGSDAANTIGEIFLRNGANVSSGGLNLGNQGHGRMEMFGEETLFVVAGNLSVGNNGKGHLTVAGGSKLQVDQGELRDFNIGFSNNSEGIIAVTGSGSRFEGQTTDLFVGGSRLITTLDDEGNELITGGGGGSGILEVMAGGLIETGGTLTIWEKGRIALDNGKIKTDNLLFSDSVSETDDRAVLAVVIGGGNPNLEVVGDADLGAAGLEASLADGFSPQPNQSFVLIQAGGSLTGTFTGLPEGAALTLGEHTFRISYQNGSVVLTEDSEPTGETFDQWIAGFGLPPGETSPEANPSGDGVANLVKYAMGLSPLESNRHMLPVGTITEIDGENYLVIDISKKPNAVSISFVVEVSGDLVNWENGDGATVVLEDTQSRLRVRDAVPVRSGSLRFIRLRINLN